MKTKLLPFFFILFFLVLSINPAFSQAPGYAWAKNATGTSSDFVTSSATDASGNLMITGYYSSSSIGFGSTTLTNAGNSDIFVVKYSPTGNVIWRKTIGGTNDDEGNAICTDAAGNIYVTGYFTSHSITFGSYTLNNSSASQTAFVVKYNSGGVVTWAKTIADLQDGTYVGGNGISVDAAGNVVVTGSFTNATLVAGTDTVSNAGYVASDAFVEKFNALGSPLWIKAPKGDSNDQATAITCDASNNIFVTGTFWNQYLIFGNDTLVNAGGLTGKTDIFIAKYDPSGNVLMAKGIGGPDNDVATSVCTDPSDNLLLAGYYANPSIAFDAITIVSAGATDMFIAKYDNTGNIQWAKSKGGSGDDYAYDICADAAGRVIIAGAFASSNINFGTSALISNSNPGSNDLFVASLNASGTGIWAEEAGNAYTESANSVCLDGSGNILVAGTFSSANISLGSDYFNNTNLAGGTDDIIVFKLNSPTAGIDEGETNNMISVYPNPAGNTLTIANVATGSTLNITDITGKLIHNSVITDNHETINVTDFVNGIYFIRITSNRTVSSGKFIVNK